jgi:outer membrane protein OmpA-like peptidoglycan-associated protein
MKKNLLTILMLILSTSFLGGCATFGGGISPPPLTQPSNSQFDNIFAELAREEKGASTNQEALIQKEDFPQDPFQEEILPPYQDFTEDEAEPFVQSQALPNNRTHHSGEVEYYEAQTGGLEGRLTNVEISLKAALGIETREVNFTARSTELDARGKGQIQDIVNMPGYRVLWLVGFSSLGGGKELNKQLSIKRAQTVGDALAQAGFDTADAKMKHGPETNMFGRSPQDNQRVTVVLQKK